MENVKWMSVFAGGFLLASLATALLHGDVAYVIATGLAGVTSALLALADGA